MSSTSSFQHYVFFSRRPTPTDAERAAGVYLLEMAEARYLEKFFGPLYRSAGLALSSSSDELISGDGLVALQEAIAEAIKEVRGQPEKWPIVVGHTFEPFQQTLGTPIVRYASRQRLLAFLESVTVMIQNAQNTGGYLHFGGGG
jgi:hypothetical protein